MEQQLTELVKQKMSSYDIAKIIGKSPTHTRRLLDKYGLVTDGRSGYGRRKKKYLCKFCGETDPHKMAKQNMGKTHFSCCNICRNLKYRKTNRNRKLEAISLKGGKCETCGYNRCPAALDFHHRDPSQKDPNWKSLRYQVLNDHVKAELAKCILLCSNCHAEVHYFGEHPVGPERR